LKSKIYLREKYKKLRNNLDKDFIMKNSLKLCLKLYKYLKSFKFKKIMLYYPLKNEINVKPLFYYFKNKVILFPKVEGFYIFPYKIKSLKHLKKGKFRIFEPSKNFAKMLRPDVVIVPGIVFDKEGYRLGFGKGYYDRFLKSFMFKIGVTLDKFLVNKLPREYFDKKVDLIITPRRKKNVNKRYIKRIYNICSRSRYWRSCKLK